MSNGGETDLRAIAAHKVYKNVARTQEGGTGILIYGDLLEQFDSEKSGKDEVGLDRWTHMCFKDDDGYMTLVLVVCGYNPCYNHKQGSNTVYQQHRRYLINKKKDESYPIGTDLGRV